MNEREAHKATNNVLSDAYAGSFSVSQSSFRDMSLYRQLDLDPVAIREHSDFVAVAMGRDLTAPSSLAARSGEKVLSLLVMIVHYETH